MDQHKVKVNDIKIQKKNLGQYSAIHLTSVWVNKAFTVVYGKKRQFFSPTWEIPRRQDRSILPPFRQPITLTWDLLYLSTHRFSHTVISCLGHHWELLWYMYIVCCFTTHFFTLNILIDQLSLIDFTVCGSERCFGSFGKKLRIMEDLSILCFVGSTSIGSKYYFLIFGRDAKNPSSAH